MADPSFIERFATLDAIEGLTHGFLLRSPDIEVRDEREAVLERLEPFHTRLLAELGIDRSALATGQQVHDRHIAMLSGDRPGRAHFLDTDALVTTVPGQALGVWVADCAAVYLVDPVTRTCGIAHSGKKGTELGIVPAVIERMGSQCGSRAADLIVQIAPCIRPPAYEIDFAARIVADCVAAGVPAAQVHDCLTCTTSDLGRYYSYRLEKGATGRMFAVIRWNVATPA